LVNSLIINWRGGIKVMLALTIVAFCLFEFVLRRQSGVLGEVEAALVEMQWMLLVCLAVWCGTFSLLAFSTNDLPLIGLLLLAVVAYFNGHAASPGTDTITLLAGVTLGRGAAYLLKSKKPTTTGGQLPLLSEGAAEIEVRSQKPEAGNNGVALIVFVFVVLLTVASMWRPDGVLVFGYRGNARWDGPWDNPNIFGLLMGTGFALATGSAVSSFQFSVFSQTKKRDQLRKVIYAFSFLLTAILMGRGLLHSFSRGAWIATLCGLVYLAAQVFSFQFSALRFWLRRNWLPLSVVTVSVLVILFWQFRWAEWLPVRRAFSVANVNDFSWRNRIVAWEGALQIAAQHPWLGAGWNRTEQLYEHYYLSPRLTESAAVQMNDYLMLGATLGVPALVCFCMYFWICLTRSAERGGWNRCHLTPALSLPSGSEEGIVPAAILNLPPSDWLGATCRAGAIVLLVGFWFDGGLFKLPTAATFWILLELGRADAKVEGRIQNEEGHGSTKKEERNESCAM